jgi:drug/metabolite transporter (DMT)-like permease
LLSAALALTSSVAWGISDFIGGLLARRHSVPVLLVVSQGSGLAALAVVTVGLGRPLERGGIELGFLGGLFGALSAAAFYQALALGTISVVSPLLACGSVLAFGLAIAWGERPSLLSVAGALIALLGVILVSLREHAASSAGRRALPYALAAPTALGAHLFLVGRASEAGGSFSAALGSRLGSVLLLVLFAIALRPSFRLGLGVTVSISLVGVATASALVLFGFAAELGLISIASMLSSLYPIVTVVLAHAFLGERLRGSQLVGVLLALVGVALVAAR